MFCNTDRRLKVVALIVIALLGATGVYAARGMYSDGAYWLVEMLPRGGFYFFDPHRAYVQALVQAPVALAIGLGISDLNVLIRLHSFGFVCGPLIFWLGALILQFGNRLFWLFLMAFTVSYLRSNFFAAGEFSVAYGMTALCASILMRAHISLLQALMMVVTATLLTHSYEATLFLGTFLALLALIRLLNVSTDDRAVRVLTVISAGMFLVSVYIGARSTFFQRSYDGKGAANLGALTEVHLLYLAVIPALATLICSAVAKRFQAWLFACAVVLMAAYLLYVFRLERGDISYGYYSYAYRALCCFLLVGVLVIATAFRFWPAFFRCEPAAKSTNKYVAISVFTFFGSMAALMFFHTYGYYQWAKRFEDVAIAIKTHTPIDQSGINANHGWTHGYNWHWGNPSTSILLRGNAEAMVLNHSNHDGSGPNVYESTKTSANVMPSEPAPFNPYPLKPFEKRSLLFKGLR